MHVKKKALFAALTALQLAAVPAFADEPAPRISMSGEGSVAAAPDMATIRLGVASQAATAAEALRANTTDLAKVLEDLKTLGMEPRDMQTSGLRLNPVWDHSKEGSAPVISGYEANNGLTLRVRDLSRLGETLDRAVQMGANTFDGLSFDLVDSQALADEARALAVADARRRAELIATAAGVRLGRILSIEEGDGARVVMQSAEFARAASAVMDKVPTEGGEVDVKVTVNIVWEIADGPKK